MGQLLTIWLFLLQKFGWIVKIQRVCCCISCSDQRRFGQIVRIQCVSRLHQLLRSIQQISLSWAWADCHDPVSVDNISCSDPVSAAASVAQIHPTDRITWHLLKSTLQIRSQIFMLNLCLICQKVTDMSSQNSFPKLRQICPKILFQSNIFIKPETTSTDTWSATKSKVFAQNQTDYFLLKSTNIYQSLEPDSRLAILIPTPNNCQVLSKESEGFKRLSDVSKGSVQKPQ